MRFFSDFLGFLSDFMLWPDGEASGKASPKDKDTSMSMSGVFEKKKGGKSLRQWFIDISLCVMEGCTNV